MSNDTNVTEGYMELMSFTTDIQYGIDNAINDKYDPMYSKEYPGYSIGYNWMQEQIAKFKLQLLIEGKKL